MHPNPTFRNAPRQQNIAFARDISFGMLSINADPAPLISHVPFQLSDDGTRLEAHLVRSNPIARALTEAPRPAAIAIQGPHGYILPDWYGIEDQVPTWNYAAVHLRGDIRLLPDSALRGVLDRLSAAMETRLVPKPAWLADKMDPDTLARMMRMMRMILPFEMDVTRIDGTWKFSQNKPDAARISAAEGVAAAGSGAQTDQLAAWMKDPPA